MVNDMYVVLSILCIIILIILRKHNKAINRWNDREEFYSSDCDESLIKIGGVSINPSTQEIVGWHVHYKNTVFYVPMNNMDLSEYVDSNEWEFINGFKKRKDPQLKGIHWDQMISLNGKGKWD